MPDGEKECMSLVNSHVGERKEVYKHDNFTSWWKKCMTLTEPPGGEN